MPFRGPANETVPKADRTKLIEVVETELEGLHEGNIARYRLRPSKFKLWHAKWNK